MFTRRLVSKKRDQFSYTGSVEVVCDQTECTLDTVVVQGLLGFVNYRPEFR